MHSNQLPLPSFPRKKGRPRIHTLPLKELQRLKMKANRRRKREAGLRPVNIWLPIATIEAASVRAKEKDATREEILASVLNEGLLQRNSGATPDSKKIAP